MFNGVKLAMYRKGIVFGIGLLMLGLKKYFGVQIGISEEHTREITDWIILGLTLFGVVKVPNAQATQPPANPAG